MFLASLDGNTEIALTGGTAAPNGWTGESFNFIGTGSDILAFGAQTNPGEWGLDNVSVVQDLPDTGVETTYTVNVGTYVEAPGTAADVLNLANIATGQADWLSGSLSASGDAAFSDVGLGPIGTIGAGDSTPLTIDLSTVNAGIFTQTITLTADSTNPAGASQLANETIVAIGTVLAPASLAQPVINEPSPIVLPDVHVASLVPNDQIALDIGNTGSDTLSGFVSAATGDAYGSGTIAALAPGLTDTADIIAGLNNTQAGSLSGTVNLSFASGTNDVALSPQTVSLEGNVYRYATPISPARSTPSCMLATASATWTARRWSSSTRPRPMAIRRTWTRQRSASSAAT